MKGKKHLAKTVLLIALTVLGVLVLTWALNVALCLLICWLMDATFSLKRATAFWLASSAFALLVEILAIRFDGRGMKKP